MEEEVARQTRVVDRTLDTVVFTIRPIVWLAIREHGNPC